MMGDLVQLLSVSHIQCPVHVLLDEKTILVYAKGEEI